jgi:hypothetical protein
MPLALPYAGQPAENAAFQSRPVRENFQAITDKFNGGIVNADISATANIDGTKLLDGSVPGAKLVAGAVGATQLGTDAVLTANIKDSTGATDGVTGSKLATGAVTSDKLATDAVIAPKIAAQAVLSGKIKTIVTTVAFGAGATDIAAGNAITYDLSSAAPATGVTVTNPITVGTATPFLSYRQGALATLFSGDKNRLSIGLAFDTTASKWRLVLRNDSDAAGDNLLVDVNGLTVIVVSIAVT